MQKLFYAIALLCGIPAAHAQITTTTVNRTVAELSTENRQNNAALNGCVAYYEAWAAGNSRSCTSQSLLYRMPTHEKPYIPRHCKPPFAR